MLYYKMAISFDEEIMTELDWFISSCKNSTFNGCLFKLEKNKNGGCCYICYVPFEQMIKNIRDRLAEKFPNKIYNIYCCGICEIEEKGN